MDEPWDRGARVGLEEHALSRALQHELGLGDRDHREITGTEMDFEPVLGVPHPGGEIAEPQPGGP